MRYTLALCIAALACLLVVPFAAADTGSAATATPWVYDPDGLGNSSSVWESPGGINVLDLQKNADTSSNQAAGATIDGFAGDPLFQLSFDYRGYCGAGAPRINVYVGEQTDFFGCAYGTHTALADGWVHVEFNSCVPGDGSNGALCNFWFEDWTHPLSIIDGADIVQDEGPAQVELRNVMVDDITLGPPAAPLPPVQEQRAGYCASHVVARPGQDAGLFLDLLRGQNTAAEWSAANAKPAFELQPSGAITCLLPAGYITTGQVDGIYPIAQHVPLASSTHS